MPFLFHGTLGRMKAWKLIFSSFMILVAARTAFAVTTESSLNIQGHLFSYFENHSLKDANADIDTAIIVVHGSDRNAITYYGTIVGIADQLGKSKTTMVIAPHFKLSADSRLTNELSFTDEGWLRGDVSTDQAISSFAVIDEFINRLSDASLFPKLKTIIVTGHSAGGQLTQRYALGSPLQPQNIAIRYIVTNPGSYAYLSSKRPVSGKTNSFEIPQTRCADYDDYKYGLQHLNAYLGQTSSTEIVNRYLNREVTYLLGEADLITDELDNDCEAVLQGKTRFERGKNFKASLDQEFPGNLHKIATVPGVGHTEYGMYRSEVGKKVLFPDYVMVPVTKPVTAPSPAPESMNKKSLSPGRPSGAKTPQSFLSQFLHLPFQP